MKRRRSITLGQKKAIISAAESGFSGTELIKIFELPRSTISTILKNRDAIMISIEEGNNTQRAKLKRAANQELEEALLSWVNLQRANNNVLNGRILKEKALNLAKLLNNDKFTASNGWLTKFKKRHAIIKNCFSKDGLDQQASTAGELKDDEQMEVIQGLADHHEHANQQLTLNDIVIGIDAGLYNSGVTPTMMDIVRDQDVIDIETVESKDAAVEEAPHITWKEAQSAWDTVYRYMEENCSDINLIRKCHEIDDQLFTMRLQDTK